MSKDDQKDYNTVKKRFDTHLIKIKNVIFERAKFNRKSQEQVEPVTAVSTFITTLYTLAEHCGYRVLHSEMIRDRIVVGIRDMNLSELLLESVLTLDKAITEVFQSETIRNSNLY